MGNVGNGDHMTVEHHNCHKYQQVDKYRTYDLVTAGVVRKLEF